jgi:hypothetical protein
MMSSTTRTSSASLERAMDDALLAYVDWREESAAVWHAYAGWENRAAEDKVWAYAAYLAALDREEAAANDYRRLVELVGLLLGPR